MRDDRERLMDILEAIERIQKYTVRGEEAFRSNELIQNWVTSNIQMIGEARKRSPESFPKTGSRNPMVRHHRNAPCSSARILRHRP
jgi:uncharacterized protein with HEPN domain